MCALSLSLAIGAGSAGAAERPGATSLASIPVVDLPRVPIFWHLDTFPTRTEADAAKAPRSVVVETFGKVWLFTLAEADWRPARGSRVAVIGPLEVRPGARYTASYMRAETSPGFRTDVHQHPGPEAVFTLSGEVCVETPDGKFVGRVGGEPLLINRDIPMQLTSIGSEVRRSIVLILHDAGLPWRLSITRPWSPKGLCVD